VADIVAALEEEFSDVAETKVVTQAPEHGKQNDVARELEIVEGRTSAFVEPTPTGAAREGSVSQCSTVLPPRDARRSTMRARLERLLVWFSDDAALLEP
jgi:hypothetical protein